MENVLPNNLLKIINDGENVTTEFKTAKKKLPSNLFDTICAMLNRMGGHIFLGVEDSGEIVGVYKEYTYDEKVILYIYVHESSDVHRSVNKVFDRNDDGDFDITANTTQISNMYIRKSSTYIENKIYPFATMDDLRKDLIEQARIELQIIHGLK